MMAPGPRVAGCAGLFFLLSLAGGFSQSEDVAGKKISATASIGGLGAKASGVVSVKDDAVVLSVPDGRDSQADYTLANGQKVLDQVKEKDFPVHLETFRPPGQGKHYLSVKDFEVKSVGEWRRAMDAGIRKSDQAVLKEVNDNVEALASRAKEAIAVPAGEQDWTGVLEQYRLTRESVARVYAGIDDPVLRSDLAILTENLAREEKIFLKNKLQDAEVAPQANDYVENLTAVQKRFYRLNDNYRPEIYPLINRQCASVVAIADRAGNPNPVGTGVIIGDDLVLTAAHVLKPDHARSFAQSDYVVWTDFEERRFDPQLANVVCECEEVYRSPDLDFVLLRIRRKDTKGPVGRTPVPLSEARIARWTPIFLVGYPQGNRRTVHDSSWVLFPHRLVDREEWSALETEVNNEYLERDKNPDENVRKERAANRARDFMNDRYEKTGEAQASEYVLKSKGKEYIGIESDTFEGDSGAPAMLREGGALIGILYEGEPDVGPAANTPDRRPEISSRPGAQLHEKILPISAIAADLDQRYPAWRGLGVTFQ